MNYRVGERIGDYEITAVLGAGGMGEVYQARHRITHRIEAIKVLKGDMRNSSELAERFLREVRLHAALKHPNIADLHTAVWAGSQLAMVMEYVDGDGLETRLLRGPRFTPREAVAIIDQLLDALHYAHSRGIVHRDVKPSNIMTTRDGRVKVMDFGIAKGLSSTSLTSTGLSIGTPAYMAPEQISGGEVDGRADLYGASVTLYEMLSGTRPFAAAATAEMIEAKLRGEPRELPADLDVPPALRAAVMRGLARNRDERFESAAAYREELARCRQPPRPAAPLPKPRPVASAPTPSPADAPSSAGSPPSATPESIKAGPMVEPWLGRAIALIGLSALIGFSVPWIASRLTEPPSAERASPGVEIAAPAVIPNHAAEEESAPPDSVPSPAPPRAVPATETPRANPRPPAARAVAEPPSGPSSEPPEAERPAAVGSVRAEEPTPAPAMSEPLQSAAPPTEPSPAPDPTPEAVDDRVYDLADGVSAPQLIHRVEPVYSAAARRAGLSGAVELVAEIWPDGEPRNIRVVRGLDPELDRAAIDALRQWRFGPGYRDGRSVKVRIPVRFNFRRAGGPQKRPSLGVD